VRFFPYIRSALLCIKLHGLINTRSALLCIKLHGLINLPLAWRSDVRVADHGAGGGEGLGGELLQQGQL